MALLCCKIHERINFRGGYSMSSAVNYRHYDDTWVRTRVTPRPRPREMVRMKRLRRLKPSMEMTLMPLTHTDANRKVVMPPSTL